MPLTLAAVVLEGGGGDGLVSSSRRSRAKATYDLDG